MPPHEDLMGHLLQRLCHHTGKDLYSVVSLDLATGIREDPPERLLAHWDADFVQDRYRCLMDLFKLFQAENLVFTFA